MSTALRYEEMPEEAGGESSERQAETLERDADGMVPQKHGGKLWAGRPRNVVAGPGRPKDEVRAKLAELGASKAVPFLSELLDGRISVDLVGKCTSCGNEQSIDMDWVKAFVDVYRSSADLRLKASEQALKYGVGIQKEISVQTVRGRVAATLEVIRRQCPPELAASIVAELRGVWA